MRSFVRTKRLFSALLVSASIGLASTASAGAAGFISPTTAHPPIVHHGASANPAMVFCPRGSYVVETTYWSETNDNPLQFTEFTQNWYWNTDHGDWWACGGGALPYTTCNAGAPGCPTGDTADAPPGGISRGKKGCRCFVLTAPTGIFITRIKKGTVQILSTLQTGSAIAVDDAATADGTIFTSMQPNSPSGNAEVYVYAPGSSTPTTVLESPVPASAAGVAVDSAHNVYWASSPTSGSVGCILWKFPYYGASGYGSPVALYSANAGPISSVQVTRKGDIVLVDTYFLEILTPDGMPKTQKGIDGYQSIRLNKSETMLTIAGGNEVSVLAFPSLAVLESGQLNAGSGSDILPVSAMQVQ